MPLSNTVDARIRINPEIQSRNLDHFWLMLEVKFPQVHHYGSGSF